MSAHIKNSETIIQYILDNQLDIALVEGSVSNPQIVQQPFLSDHLCLIAASDHPLSARQSVTTSPNWSPMIFTAGTRQRRAQYDRRNLRRT